MHRVKIFWILKKTAYHTFYICQGTAQPLNCESSICLNLSILDQVRFSNSDWLMGHIRLIIGQIWHFFASLLRILATHKCVATPGLRNTALDHGFSPALNFFIEKKNHFSFFDYKTNKIGLIVFVFCFVDYLYEKNWFMHSSKLLRKPNKCKIHKWDKTGNQINMMLRCECETIR